MYLAHIRVPRIWQPPRGVTLWGRHGYDIEEGTSCCLGRKKALYDGLHLGESLGKSDIHRSSGEEQQYYAILTFNTIGKQQGVLMGSTNIRYV